ncbi:hypothetical protein [Kibdelosporangium aridum]|uniref:hypothetical protein n=1 Tax=Kibdelosporangium aridum TaxID=2030 RepID=UPI0035EFB107
MTRATVRARIGISLVLFLTGFVFANWATLAYLGSFAGPALIGGLAHYVGLAAALLLPALLVTASALGARALTPARTITPERGHP